MNETTVGTGSGLEYNKREGSRMDTKNDGIYHHFCCGVWEKKTKNGIKETVKKRRKEIR